MTAPRNLDRVTFDADGTLDEVVMSNAFVHLEHLDTTSLGRKTYMLIIENEGEHVHLTIDRARDVLVYERYTPEDTK